MHLTACAFAALRPLLPSELERLRRDRFVVVNQWLTDEETAALQVDALAVDGEAGGECTIGKTGGRLFDPRVRRSRQVSFYPSPPNTAGSVQTRADLIAAANALRAQLQSAAELSLPKLEPFETELIYLRYPVGGHYRRHLDIGYADAGWQRHGRRASEGGSLSGYRTRRVVSMIVYLNKNWDAADGGALRVFPARDRGYGRPESELAPHVAHVPPEGGTLVLLMSADVEHTVPS